jgi:hypothetical protein
MSHKKTNEYLGEATLSSVMKEMARPRLAASVREGSGRTVTARGKFPVGALLHNRNTKEDGLVTKVYQLGGGGAEILCMR